MWRVIWFVVLTLLIVAGVLVYRILNAGGYFVEINPQFAGECQEITGVTGAEDIELDRQTGAVFLSSQDRRAASFAEGRQGGIYLTHIDRPGDAAKNLTAEFVGTFHPHGISLFTDGNGKKTLAVVNHTAPGQTEIDLFDVNESRGPGGDVDVTLALRRAVKDPLFISPNDVTLVGHDTFYITNDHGSETALGETLETWLLLPRANVVYYDAAVARVVAGNLNYANGINHSADLATIYVAEATGRTLTIYRRDVNTGALEAVHALFLNTGADNIDVDSDGNLWIGAHPSLLKFLDHAKDAKNHSPSQVLRINPAAEDGAIQTIYMNAGEQISGSSVAVYDKGRLLIGPVFDPKFLSCKLKS